jgi:methyl coenzyme M reductase subunit C-like uncharacterized protein (methanogenesis marker protein 7)
MNPNPIHYLDAAYIVGWLVYLGYLGRILWRMKRAEEEKSDLDRAR